MKRVLLALMTLTVMVSCEKIIEYNGKETSPQIVINSITQAGDSVTVKVFRSRFFLERLSDGDNLNLSDAEVFVSINGSERPAAYDTTLCAYTDSRVLKESDVVQVRASHPKYGHAQACDVVPAGVSLSVESQKKLFDRTASKDFYYSWDVVALTDSVWSISVKIDASPEYFYRLSFQTISISQDSICNGLSFYLSPQTEALFEDIDLMDFMDYIDTDGDDSRTYYNLRRTFCIDGSRLDSAHELVFNVCLSMPVRWLYYSDGGMDPDGLTIDSIDMHVDYLAGLKVETLSDAYYYYNKSVEDYEDADGELFLEPVKIIGNVQGGLGCVGTYTSRWSELSTSLDWDSVSVMLPDYY